MTIKQESNVPAAAKPSNLESSKTTNNKSAAKPIPNSKPEITKGTFVKLTYIGRVKETGEVFDTTEEEIAKKNELGGEHAHYGPVTVCVGEQHVLLGLDKFLIGKEPGHYVVNIIPQEGFGMKDTQMIQLITSAKFKEQKIDPYPGLIIDVDGARGIVRNSAGGRILVDFNHPLAGKELVYDIDILGTEEDVSMQISAILDKIMHVHGVKIDVAGEGATITIPMDMPEELKEAIGDKIIKLTKVKTVGWKKGNKEEHK